MWGVSGQSSTIKDVEACWRLQMVTTLPLHQFECHAFYIVTTYTNVELLLSSFKRSQEGESMRKLLLHTPIVFIGPRKTSQPGSLKPHFCFLCLLKSICMSSSRWLRLLGQPYIFERLMLHASTHFWLHQKNRASFDSFSMLSVMRRQHEESPCTAEALAYVIYDVR